MSEAKANGAVIVGGAIEMPRVGPWTAELDVDLASPDSVSGHVTITTGDLVFEGTSIDAGTFTEKTRLRMVGGAGGLGAPAAPGFYHATPARIPIADALAFGNEKLSATADAGKLQTLLSLWTRRSCTVGEALEQLVDELDVAWRILRDGTLWLGTETWPGAATMDDLVILADVPHEARIEFASASPLLVPGTTFLGRRVGRVEIRFSAEATRTTAWFEDASKPSVADPIINAISGLVRQETFHTDFHTMHGATVASQNGDGTLELKLNSTKLPGMSRVPIRAGVLDLKVKPGADVTVAFLEGSPAKPCVVHVDPAGILEATLAPTTKITMNAANIVAQDGRPLARVGDMVQVLSTPPGTPAIGQIMTGNNFHRG